MILWLCLTEEPRLRPPADEMLKHKFIGKCKYGAYAMGPNVEKARQVRASMDLQAKIPAPDVPEDNPAAGLKVNEDYGDTVPSKPQNIRPAAATVRKQAGATLPAGGDFGTFIVHGIDEMGTTATRAQLSSEKQSSPAFGHVGNRSLG